MEGDCIRVAAVAPRSISTDGWRDLTRPDRLANTGQEEGGRARDALKHRDAVQRWRIAAWTASTRPMGQMLNGRNLKGAGNYFGALFFWDCLFCSVLLR